MQRSRKCLQVYARREANAVERGIRNYQYNASGAVKKGAQSMQRRNPGRHVAAGLTTAALCLMSSIHCMQLLRASMLMTAAEAAMVWPLASSQPFLQAQLQRWQLHLTQ